MSEPEPDTSAPSAELSDSDAPSRRPVLPEGNDEDDSGEADAPSSERASASFRRRLSSMLLIPGLGLALWFFYRESPRETELVLKLEGGRAMVTHVEASLSSQTETEQLAGAAWSFQAGQAPPTVRTMVKVPAGEWLLSTTVQLERGGRQESSRRITLEGGTVTIPVRVEAGE